MSNVYSQYDFRFQKIKIRISYIYNEGHNYYRKIQNFEREEIFL